MLPLRYPKAWLGLGLVLLAVALTLALLPQPRGVPIVYNDKVTHALAFATLMSWFSGIFRFRLAPALALALVGYGALIEILQSFTPTRQPELADLVADTVGILLGWLLCAAGLRHWCSRVESWLMPR